MKKKVGHLPNIETEIKLETSLCRLLALPRHGLVFSHWVTDLTPNVLIPAVGYPICYLNQRLTPAISNIWHSFYFLFAHRLNLTCIL
jgi:hypothetical protein